MTLQLRGYQTDLAKRATKALATSKSVVVQLETGAGKTHIAAKMCRAWHRQRKRVWFIAHRREILDQAQKIFDDAGIPHGPSARIQFRMIVSAVRASRQELAPDVLIFDECHHAPAKTWAEVMAASPKALRLGLTATPGRLDGAPLGDYFAEIVQGPSPKELRDAGHLARYRYFAPVVPDLSGVKVRKEEYDRAAVTEIMSGPSIVGDVVEHYQRHAAGKRAILFAVSVDASRDMAGRFNKAGIPALHIDADTPDDQRAAAIAAVRRGKVKVLCNVELFTEGFDLPAIDAVILLRPTRSLALFRQMLGRGARPSRAKTIILDHAALVAEHGLPDEEYEWTLDGNAPRRKIEIEGGERARMRRCPECNAVHVWAAACEECGHEYVADPRTVTEIGGRLEEVSRPPGCVTVAEYELMLGVSRGMAGEWIKKGMPAQHGFIIPQQANEWRVRRRETMRAASSARTKAQMANPEMRQAAADGIKRWLNTPQARAARERANEKIRTPESRAAAAAITKAQMATPEARAANQARGKARFSNPENRAKVSEATRARLRNPEARAALSEANKAFWKNVPGAREAASARAKARNSTPEAKAAFVIRIAAARKARKLTEPE